MEIIERRTDIDIQIVDRQTERKRQKEIDRRQGLRIDRWWREKERITEREREREREVVAHRQNEREVTEIGRDRWTDRERAKHTEIEEEAERETQRKDRYQEKEKRQKETDIDRNRERERSRDKKRQKNRQILYIYNQATQLSFIPCVQDRLWRKSRSVVEADSGCVGVDLNRNWSPPSGEPQDTNPCSRTYPGKHPLSEPGE